jgi:ribose transport system permease protein
MFVTTVAMLSVLSALATSIINTKGAASGTSISISVPTELRGAFESLDNIWFKLLVLVLFAALCLFVFNYTKIGRRQKFLGGNPICAKMTGISNSVYGIIAFIIAGLGVGLGSFMTIVYTPTVSTTTAGSIGMSVFIAIVFGGMPISGGPRSKVYAAIVGGFSYMLLKNILFILFSSVGQARDGYVQIISAGLFLVVVFAASVNYRSKNLPR